MQDLETISREAGRLVKEANGFAIATDDEYTAAAGVLGRIAGALAGARDFFAPGIEAAHKAHKVAIATSKQITDPLEAAKTRLSREVGAYRQRKDGEARALKAKLEAEERKRLEDTQVDVAASLEGQGRHLEAAAAIARPVQAPSVHVETAPEVQGLSFRENWAAEVFSMSDLIRAVFEGKAPAACLIADEKFLGQQARSLKGEMRIPGVRVVMNQTPVQRVA